MKTTVCILSYNAQEITEKCIECLFLYTSNINLIVIDNGSHDNSDKFLSSYFKNNVKNFSQAELCVVLNKNNLGVIGGRNQGFALFLSNPTEYLCFLDNDQFVQQNWLEQHLEYCEKNNLDIVGADAWLMDKNFMPRHHCTKQNDPYTYVGCGGMLIKRHVVDKIGFFDQQFNPAYFEDPDYNFRALQSGFKIGFNRDAKIMHMAHQTLGKIANKNNIFRESYNKFCKKWANYTPTIMR